MQAARKAEYDLSIYEPRIKKQPKQKATASELVVIKKQEKRKQARIFATVRTAGIVLMFAAMLSAIIYSNAKLSEITNQISTLNVVHSNYVSENKKLAADIESKMSLRNVEEIAVNELGLSKLEPYQVQYIYRSEGDVIILTEHSPAENKGVGVKESFVNVLEYLRIVFNKN